MRVPYKSHLSQATKQVSGNPSGEFVIRTDLLPFILGTPVPEYFLLGTSTVLVHDYHLCCRLSLVPQSHKPST